MDQDTRLVYSSSGAAANVHNGTVTLRPLTHEERNIYSDSRYLGTDKCEALSE